ncbi:hypothetical protein ACFP2F_20660 [Hymenobacter artigasi]|uniref:DUF3408 domain-containing protein n=1 Tax=Hymenobacter artigasi TaxID=2719616 RepID=A0ABX1HMU8_9BACT|nr:hypothetical protein [Hymenobacter artigasi]NKI91578.1 hypothetical protein [Hymenobacter artigasi]
MAKTFKNLSPAGEPATPKPASEMDFFDLSDSSAPVQKPVDKAVATNGESNTVNSVNTGNISKPKRVVKAAVSTAPAAVEAGDATDGVRQTFVLSRGHLEQLRDYVHARRSGGDYTYSQKQALQQGLDLLFATAEPAAPRPAQTREQEQQRRERIQRGRQVKSSE